MCALDCIPDERLEKLQSYDDDGRMQMNEICVWLLMFSVKVGKVFFVIYKMAE